METENQAGVMETFEVAYTFGWDPLQQYLVKFPDGRLQVCPLAGMWRKEMVSSIRMKKSHIDPLLDSFPSKLGPYVC